MAEGGASAISRKGVDDAYSMWSKKLRMEFKLYRGSLLTMCVLCRGRPVMMALYRQRPATMYTLCKGRLMVISLLFKGRSMTT